MCEYTEGYGDYARLNNIVLEVPDNEPQFKPFDRVLVRDISGQWSAAYYSHYDKEEDKYSCGGVLFDECIQYEGNKHLVGTTNNPK